MMVAADAGFCGKAGKFTRIRAIARPRAMVAQIRQKNARKKDNRKANPRTQRLAVAPLSEIRVAADSNQAQMSVHGNRSMSLCRCTHDNPSPSSVLTVFSIS